MELEATWGRALHVWWAIMWRNLIGVLAAMVIGGIIGGILGFVMSMVGAPAVVIQLVAMPVGGVIGLAISVVPVKMILGKDFGEFRLVLVQKTP